MLQKDISEITQGPTIDRVCVGEWGGGGGGVEDFFFNGRTK